MVQYKKKKTVGVKKILFRVELFALVERFGFSIIKMFRCVMLHLLSNIQS